MAPITTLLLFWIVNLRASILGLHVDLQPNLVTYI
jgi:hypothetical protein